MISPFVVVACVCHNLCVTVSKKVGISWKCGCTKELLYLSVTVFNDFDVLSLDVYCYSYIPRKHAFEQNTPTHGIYSK